MRIGSNSLRVQTLAVLDHLRYQGSITALEALDMYGCFRLAARIYDLRKLGHLIITVRIITGNGKNIAEYHLLKQEHDFD
jgi:Helix-turn-helix domain